MGKALYILLVLGFVSIFPPAACAFGRLDVCGVLSFQAEDLELPQWKAETSSSKCAKWGHAGFEVLIFTGVTLPAADVDTANFYIKKQKMRSSEAVMKFFKLDTSGDAYYFDIVEFLSAANDWPIYQHRMNELFRWSGGAELQPVAEIRQWKTSTGRYILCKIRYLNSAGESRYFEQHLYFLKGRGVTASYNSLLIDEQDRTAVSAQEKVLKIFESMRSLH